MTSEQMDNLVTEMRRELDQRIADALKHYEAGRRDCGSGIYDKWYRYNAYQDGRAYDLGWMEANEEVRNEEVKFLEP